MRLQSTPSLWEGKSLKGAKEFFLMPTSHFDREVSQPTTGDEFVQSSKTAKSGSSEALYGSNASPLKGMIKQTPFYL